MAIYRTGRASMDAQGYVTGTGGTKWREQLTLIRSGATIVFLTSPSSFATISEVIADDRMRVVSSAGKVIPESEYVILIHDSLTVDGLAQDVAETLRYYQGKETQLEAFIEFLKGFDFSKLEQLTTETRSNAAAAAASQKAAESSEQGAASSALSALQNKESAANSAISAQQSKDSAALSADTARAEAERAHQAAIGYKGFNYLTVNAPAGADPDKYYPIVILGNVPNDLPKNGIFFSISTANFVSDSPYNSCSFSGYCRTSGWGDALDSIFGNYTINNQNEKSMYCLLTGSKETVDCFAIYVKGGAFPVKLHSENTVNVIVPTDDYVATPGGENASVFKFAASDPVSECVNIRPMIFGDSGFYASNDFVPTNKEHARDRIGLGSKDYATFQGVDSVSTIAASRPYMSGSPVKSIANIAGATTGISNMYCECKNSKWQSTIALSNIPASKYSYLQFDEDARLFGINKLEVGSAGVYSSGKIESPKSFVGTCPVGGWGLEWDYLGNPYYAYSANTGSHGGWSPVVSGGAYSRTGYHLRFGLGVLSDEANDTWPRVSLKLNGDGFNHRGFEFFHDGRIFTWGNHPWGGNYEFAKSPTSDRDLKKDIVYTNGKESFNRVMQWMPAMFKYKNQDIQRYGFIAQDLLKIDNEYVHLIPGSPIIEDVIGVDDDGNEFVHHQIETGVKDDTLCLDINVMFADLACAFKFSVDVINKNKEDIELMKKQIIDLTEAVKLLSK